VRLTRGVTGRLGKKRHACMHMLTVECKKRFTKPKPHAATSRQFLPSAHGEAKQRARRDPQHVAVGPVRVENRCTKRTCSWRSAQDCVLVHCRRVLSAAVVGCVRDANARVHDRANPRVPWERTDVVVVSGGGEWWWWW
jgi:hypothetical protein